MTRGEILPVREQLARDTAAVSKTPAAPVSFRAAADCTELEGRTGCPLSRSDVFFKVISPPGLYFQSGF